MGLFSGLLAKVAGSTTTTPEKKMRTQPGPTTAQNETTKSYTSRSRAKQDKSRLPNANTRLNEPITAIIKSSPPVGAPSYAQKAAVGLSQPKITETTLNRTTSAEKEKIERDQCQKPIVALPPSRYDPSAVTITMVQKSQSESDRYKKMYNQTLDQLNLAQQKIEELESEADIAKKRLKKARDLFQNLTQTATRLDITEKALNEATSYTTLLVSQLRESQTETMRLRSERSAQASGLSASTRTEENYLKEMLALNQKLTDIAHQMQSSAVAKQHFGDKRKIRSFRLQAYVAKDIWIYVFEPFFPALDPSVAWLFEHLKGETYSDKTALIWKSQTYSRLLMRYPMINIQAILINCFCYNARVDLDLNNPLLEASYKDMVIQVVELQTGWTLEGKNVRVLYFPVGTPFDPITMMDASGSQTDDGKDQAAIVTEPESVPSSRIVDTTVAFGFAGTAGVLQKCSVLLQC